MKLLMKYVQERRLYILCVNNHYAKFEYKGMKMVGFTDFTNQTPLLISDGKNVFSSTPVKNEKMFSKCAQYKRCTYSMCDQSLYEV